MKRRSRKWLGILGGICIIIMLLSWIPEKNEAYSELSTGISRGRAAKSLALAFVDKDICTQTENTFLKLRKMINGMFRI